MNGDLFLTNFQKELKIGQRPGGVTMGFLGIISFR